MFHLASATPLYGFAEEQRSLQPHQVSVEYWLAKEHESSADEAGRIAINESPRRTRKKLMNGFQTKFSSW
jgi:hypothetical protein